MASKHRPATYEFTVTPSLHFTLFLRPFDCHSPYLTLRELDSKLLRPHSAASTPLHLEQATRVAMRSLLKHHNVFTCPASQSEIRLMKKLQIVGFNACRAQLVSLKDAKRVVEREGRVGVGEVLSEAMDKLPLEMLFPDLNASEQRVVVKKRTRSKRKAEKLHLQEEQKQQMNEPRETHTDEEKIVDEPPSLLHSPTLHSLPSTPHSNSPSLSPLPSLLFSPPINRPLAVTRSLSQTAVWRELRLEHLQRVAEQELKQGWKRQISTHSNSSCNKSHVGLLQLNRCDSISSTSTPRNRTATASPLAPFCLPPPHNCMTTRRSLADPLPIQLLPTTSALNALVRCSTVSVTKSAMQSIEVQSLVPQLQQPNPLVVVAQRS